MLKKTIKYKDFNGEEVEEDFFFHLSKAELVEIELSKDGSLSEVLKKIVATKDGKVIMDTFKDIILRSYGERSGDGRKFIKNQELRDTFAASEAYSALFMELVLDAGKAAEFVRGIVPSDLVPDDASIMDQVIPKLQAVETKKQYTRAQLREMDATELGHASDELVAGTAIVVD